MRDINQMYNPCTLCGGSGTMPECVDTSDVYIEELKAKVKAYEEWIMEDEKEFFICCNSCPARQTCIDCGATRTDEAWTCVKEILKYEWIKE